MIFDEEKFELLIKELQESIRRMKRNTALMQMSMPDNPCRPLIQVMSKLKLIDGGIVW